MTTIRFTTEFPAYSDHKELNIISHALTTAAANAGLDMIEDPVINEQGVSILVRDTSERIGVVPDFIDEMPDRYRDLTQFVIVDNDDQ